MQIAASGKPRFVLGASILSMLMAGPSAVLLAQQPSRDDLSAAEILQKSKQAYAALSSYSDQGKRVSTDGRTGSPWIFNLRLSSSPELYRIEWHLNPPSPADPKSEPAKAFSLWSAGGGQLFEYEGAERQTVQLKEKMPMIPYSDEDAITVTHLFFKEFSNANVYCCLLYSGYQRQRDQKIADTDCHVLQSTSRGDAATLWIGKQDFLLRQVQRVHNESTTTETHTNIVLNQKFANADFIPSTAQ